MATSAPRDCRRFCALEGSGHHVKGADSMSWWRIGDCLGGPSAVDHHTVDKIVDRNSLEMTASDERKGSIKSDMAGVFPVAALLNHSCVPNSTRYFLGDTVFVRAARQLEEGEEVVTSYILNHCDLESRQESLLADYGFRCTCLRCRLEAFVPVALRPHAVSSTDDLVDIGMRSVRAALRAEELAIAVAPEALLQEASIAGLCLRGCFASVSFPALMWRLSMIRVRDPEFSSVAEIMVHAAGSAMPNSSVHSYCCSLALAAAGAGMHRGESGLSDAATRALMVHVACFGGGKELWLHRIKGGPTAVHSRWARPWEVSQLVPMASYCVPLACDKTKTSLEAHVLGARAAADIAADISATQLIISVRGRSVAVIPLDPLEVNSGNATAKFDRKHRRLEIKFIDRKCHMLTT